MNPPGRQQVTSILQALSNGDPRAADSLVPFFHNELHEIAQRCLRGERKDHTLQATALIDEAYVRLVDQGAMRWEDRAHFLAWAARIMRQVLVSHGRGRRALKRGGGRDRQPLSGIFVAARGGSGGETILDLGALETALGKLASIDDRKARIVELKFFGGLSIEQLGEVLGLSHATVEREWRFARAWLHKEVSGARGTDDGD
ncbi:MAG TPA: sigma-70 family RNA polymerase sigma factor [Planctomycetota bacterium]|nr:sigma-70 family RNA polymerase sigma factor [Planctomycetota bacterium]